VSDGEGRAADETVPFREGWPFIKGAEMQTSQTPAHRQKNLAIAITSAAIAHEEDSSEEKDMA